MHRNAVKRGRVSLLRSWLRQKEESKAGPTNGWLEA